jgi:hypothetical protein
VCVCACLCVYVYTSWQVLKSNLWHVVQIISWPSMLGYKGDKLFFLTMQKKKTIGTSFPATSPIRFLGYLYDFLSKSGARVSTCCWGMVELNYFSTSEKSPNVMNWMKWCECLLSNFTYKSLWSLAFDDSIDNRVTKLVGDSSSLHIADRIHTLKTELQKKHYLQHNL